MKYQLLQKMKFIILFFVVLLALSLAKIAVARDEITVGGYISPPFVEQDASGNVTGMTPELIDLLNSMQDKYWFKFYLTSPTRRYQDFANGKFDLMFFENKVWGWDDYKIAETIYVFNSSQVYIAPRSKAKSQSYFTPIDNKLIAGVRGFCYGFANYEPNADILTKRFKIRLVTDPISTISLALGNNVDVSVVNQTFLYKFLNKNPNDANKLFISEKYDQKSQLGFLVGQKGKISLAEMNNILKSLKEDNSLKIFWKRQLILTTEGSA